MMKKSLSILLVLGFSLVSCSKTETVTKQEEKYPDYVADNYQMKELEDRTFTVTFFHNVGKEEMDLNSGMYASGTTTALKIDQIKENEKVSRPSIDPMRQNYEFNGWHLDQVEESLYDFDQPVTQNLALYAHWTQTQDDDFVEPEYVEPSHIDNTVDHIEVSGVLNMPVVDGKVNLSNAAISRLERDDDVTSCLNYKINEGLELSSSYNKGTKLISFSATNTETSESYDGTITIKNIASELVIDNGTYENKAAKYEANDVSFEDHRIMLAGSSSIENWKTSSEDMLPLTSYNHGIGGTTVEHWQEKLNQRLVYPYSPKIVVYYVGVNNIINAGVPAVTTGEHLVQMFDDVHAHLPNTKIYYILINDLPNYMDKKPSFDLVNQYAINYAETHEYLTALNPGQGLLKENGKPNQAYFLLDGLHMSLCGYAVWGKFIKDKLISDMKSHD